MKFLGLVASHGLFLWMFFAAAPLEQLAAAGAITGGAAGRDAAFAYAAAWRHGMASNSPLYIPGFFAVAAATWIWLESIARFDRSSARFETVALALALVTGIAWVAGSFSAVMVARSFEHVSRIAVIPPIPMPGVWAMGAGLYTLVTWSAFVIGCRFALLRRSIRPLVPVPVLTAGLVAIRPWTVDDFTGIWASRVMEGDLAAIGSLMAIPALSLVLAARTRPKDVRASG